MTLPMSWDEWAWFLESLLGEPRLAPLSSHLSAERSLLIVHLAQAGSHGLKLTRLDVIDGGMVREADRLIFFVAEQTAFELARDRHIPFLRLISLVQAKGPLGVPVPLAPAPTGPALLVFEDQSAKPEERHAADPDGLHCGFQRRTDLRFAIEGHEDEDQIQKQADPAACEEGHPEQAFHDSSSLA
jgi:hypothetical protein